MQKSLIEAARQSIESGSMGRRKMKREVRCAGAAEIRNQNNRAWLTEMVWWSEHCYPIAMVVT